MGWEEIWDGGGNTGGGRKYGRGEEIWEGRRVEGEESEDGEGRKRDEIGEKGVHMVKIRCWYWFSAYQPKHTFTSDQPEIRNSC